MQLLSPEQLEHDLETIARDGFCADPFAQIARRIEDLRPAEEISTTHCAETERWLRNAEGDGQRLWSRDLTPYIEGIQDALDNDLVREVPVVGPGRCGKTVGFENYGFKRMKHGPFTDILWYMKSQSEIDNHVEKNVVPMFADHDDLQAKIGPDRGDDKLDYKRFKNGRWISWLPFNRATITNRQAGFIFGDEIDTYSPKLRDAFRQNMRQRARAIGSRSKLGMASHPDAGWNAGIALAWLESSRGIWVWDCEECGLWSSPCPRAEYRTVLRYDRDPSLSNDEAVAKAGRTARMYCPHCGTGLTDDQRRAMIDRGRWMHKGQTLDPEKGPVGEEQIFEAMGFWIHALMTKMVTLEALAKEWEAAQRHYERTRKPDLIREFMAKTLGEVYEGAGGKGKAIDPKVLAKRARGGAGEDEGSVSTFARGTVPEGVQFVVAAVDVGKAKFDVAFWGFDVEGRCWLIDRETIRDRMVDGRRVEIRPAERISDWLILRWQVLNRVLPLASDRSLRMPVAGVAVDTGGASFKADGEVESGVTWKAREFARRMALAGEAWGTARWQKVRLIKGARSADAPEIPVKASRKISVDELGRPVEPVVLEWDIGVHRLKVLAVERLAVDDGGPGQCYFADGLPQSAFDEFVGEVLIDNSWERRGPNESLDLFGYAEAVRLMLKPDRADIKWDIRPPIWARPVPIEDFEAGDDGMIDASRPARPKRPRTALERMAAINKRK